MRGILHVEDLAGASARVMACEGGLIDIQSIHGINKKSGHPDNVSFFDLSELGTNFVISWNNMACPGY